MKKLASVAACLFLVACTIDAEPTCASKAARRSGSRRDSGERRACSAQRRGAKVENVAFGGATATLDGRSRI